MTFVGILIVLFIAIRFFNKIGKSLPVIELMLLIAGSQWVFGAYNSYLISYEHFKYYMRVDESTYMSYIVPAFFLFTIILLLKTKNYNFKLDFNPEKYVVFGRYFLVIGFIADLLTSIIPSSLLFLVYIISLFKFTGAGILLFSRKRVDRIFFFAILLLLVYQAIMSSFFHDLILWGIFLFMFWAIKNKPTNKLKLLVFFIASISIFAIQTVKATFREAIYSGNSFNKLELFTTILQQNLDGNFLSNINNLSTVNIRLNQGWHISAIMDNVPQNQPFANGITVFEAVEASLVPRFLSPNKKTAGGRDNFTKYTGLNLQKNTSMGMSIIGEAYANFGNVGGMIFMSVWAWFIGWYWKKIIQISKKHPLLIFFIPLMFLQVVKAETELIVVLNHLTKVSFVIWLFFLFSKKYLNLKI